jgi:hypothetical protein
MLVLSPYPLEQCGRIGVISLGHGSIGYPVLGDDVVPVISIFLAVNPPPALRDGIFVELKTRAVRLLTYPSVSVRLSVKLSRRSPVKSVGKLGQLRRPTNGHGTLPRQR